LGVEDWAEIRRLHRAERMPIKAIARVTGVSRNTVRRALAAEAPPRYQRPARGSVVDAVEPQIRELLRAWPTMPATVIAERIGWQRSIRVLRDRVAELRLAYLPPDPASRTAYAAGELAQCDLWFPPVTPRRTPVERDAARRTCQPPLPRADPASWCAARRPARRWTWTHRSAAKQAPESSSPRHAAAGALLAAVVLAAGGLHPKSTKLATRRNRSWTGTVETTTCRRRDAVPEIGYAAHPVTTRMRDR
jgi:transposase